MRVDVDKRAANVGAASRPLLGEVHWLVVHKINARKLAKVMRSRGVIADDLTDPFSIVEWFFLYDPEGVSTTTLRGSYAAKLPVWRQWHRDGAIPAANLAKAHVPYTRVVNTEGEVAQFLDDDVSGAHAGAQKAGLDVNRHSRSIALVGDFTDEPPSKAQLLRLKHLCRDELVGHPALEIQGHDWFLGDSAKGCPGPLVPLDEVRSWAESAAAAVREGPGRR